MSAKSKTAKRRKQVKREAFKLSKFTNPSGQIVWRVSGTTKDGNRVRQNFKTELEAITKKQELEIEDVNLRPLPWRQTKLTPDEIADAERAKAELKAGTLLGAVRFFNENYQDALTPAKLTEAVEAFKALKLAAKVRPDTYDNLRFRLGAFVDYMPPDKMVHEIMAEQIEAFLFRINGKPRGKRTIKNDRLALNNFFNWATTRKHCAKNPMLDVQRVRAGSNRPAVFDLPTVRKLLKAATEHEHGKCVPYYVLGLFCGLRPQESERLTWDKIDLKEKHIFIDADTAKVTEDEHNNERFVAIEDNALEWLKPYSIERRPFAIERKDFDAIKKLAGIETWPQDVLRHTAISNYQARHTHEGLTAEWAGNSVKVIRKHYRRPIKPAEAKAYWSIYPNVGHAVGIADLPQAAPGSNEQVPPIAIHP